MIKIGKNRKLYTLDDVNPQIDPYLVDFDKVDPNKFVTSCLGQNVILEEDIKVEDVMHFFSLCRDFIYDYFNDYFDKYQALISSQQVGKRYEYVKIYKRLTVDKGYIFIEPCIELVQYDKSSLHKNDRPDFLTQIPVKMEHQLTIQQDDISADIEKLIKGMEVSDSEISDNRIEGAYKMEFTLLELMQAFLEDLIYSIEESRV